MSHPCFIHVYSNGNVWFGTDASLDPKTRGVVEAGTLVTCVRVNSDATLQKVATLTGSGNSSASALAETMSKGTGASGSKFTQKEIT